MKPGCIVYVSGQRELRVRELFDFVRCNGLDDQDFEVCGSAPLPNIYQAYLRLQRRGAVQVDTLSVLFDTERQEYRLLEQTLTVPGSCDLSACCSPVELAAAS
ncbi:MAG: hypothetical protein JW781_01235 [Deltaproteobacteria bacterium]|nr:hypothetical protein [Candidatus Anaeroferrophillacea bacterium]